MRAKGWAHVRVSAPLRRSGVLLGTEVIGNGHARLRLRPDRARPAASLRGALSYPGSWHAAGRSGEAIVSVIPQWSWGYELLVAVSPPASIVGRLAWTRRRLGRLAQGLAVALGSTAERSARAAEVRPRIKRRAPSGETASDRWLSVSATSSSPSR